MTKKIIVQILRIVIAACVTVSSYGQGTKLSSFPLATTIDTNITLVGVWDSAGRKLDKRYGISTFSSIIASAFTLDQVLYNGNVTGYSARFTDYGGNITDIDHGVMDIYGSGHHAHLTPGTLYMSNNAGGYSVLSSGANPSVGMSNVSGSSIGYIIAPTVTTDRYYRMPDTSGTVALLGNLTDFITAVDSGKFATRVRVQKAIDSLNAVIVAAGGTLQGTLTAGNMTDLTAIFGSGPDTTRINGSSTVIQSTGNKMIFSGGNIGGTPAIILGSTGYNGDVTIRYTPAVAYNNYWIKDKGGAPDTFAMVSDLTAITDSSAFSTRKWRQKGIDSLGAIISSIPGTHAPGSPNVTLGPGAGTSPGLVTVNADDLGGQVAFSTGTSPSSTPGAVVFRLTFHTAFASPPKAVLLTPANYNAALLGLITADVYVANITASYFEVVVSSSAIGTSGAYSWFFSVHP